MASVWSELKRRNVWKVAVAYAVIGWLLIEVASPVLPTFNAPQWALQRVTFVIGLGFPLALVIAWGYELTPDGIKRDQEVDRAKCVTHHAGQKLNYTIITLLVLAIGFIFVDNVVFDGESTPSRSLPGSIAVLPFASAAGELHRINSRNRLYGIGRGTAASRAARRGSFSALVQSCPAADNAWRREFSAIRFLTPTQRNWPSA